MMRDFIVVTMDDNRVVVNTRNIAYIARAGDRTRITFSDNVWLKVSETLPKIESLIWEAQHADEM